MTARRGAAVFVGIHDHRWPIFNVADAALLIGVAVLLLDGLRARRAAPAA